MKKLFLTLFAVVFALLFAFQSKVDARSGYFRVFSALTGGISNDYLDWVPHAQWQQGDISYVVTSAGDLYTYVFVAASTEAENSPWYIRADDYSTSGVNVLTTSISTGATADPCISFRDSDGAAEEPTDNHVTVCGGLTDTGDGTEDADYIVSVFIAGTLTEMLRVDADGNLEINQDADLAAGKVYKIDGTQIDIADLGAGGDWTPTGTINLGSTTDTVFKAGTVDYDDIAAGSRTGDDVKVVTGTAGTNTFVAVWNADGDLVNGTDPALWAPLATPTFTGTVVLPANQALTTPVIGAATGTSLIVTGLIDGTTSVTITTDGSESANPTDKMSHTIINKHNTEATALAITLPATAIIGMQLLIKNGQAADHSGPTTGVITVAVPATHYAWNPTTKTECAQGYDLVSDGEAGDFIGMIAISATEWESFGAQGTWTCTATP